jgi:hypothetical protein
MRIRSTGNDGRIATNLSRRIIATEINEWVEKFVFNKGHETEALARPIAEAILGDELYPVVAVNAIDGLELLASYDGITAPLYKPHWEHKQMNQELFALVTADAALPPKIYWQLEHQLAVSENEWCIFAVSDGTEKNYAECIYYSVPNRRAQLIEGWKLFDKDLETYVHQDSAPKFEGKTIKDLPALVVEISGQVKSSNLSIYQDYALKFIGSVNKDLQTDQDFADAEGVVKFCDRVEKELVVTKKQVLSQAISVNEVLLTIDYISEEHRKTRLMLSKLIESEKSNRKYEAVRAANDSLGKHIAECNEALSLSHSDIAYRVSMPHIAVDFAAAGKSKRTIDTYRSAINDVLAQAKIDSTIVLKKLQANLVLFNEIAVNHKFLFNDLQALIQKEGDSLTAIIKQRISEYESKEKARIEEEAKRIADAKIAEEAARVAAEAKRVADSEIVEAPAFVGKQAFAPAASNDEISIQKVAIAPSSPKQQNRIFTATADDIVNIIAMHFGCDANTAESVIVSAFKEYLTA